jgi:FixJ family two-component response regulator
MRAGFDGFIEKPITVRTFLAVVEDVLRTRTA